MNRSTHRHFDRLPLLVALLAIAAIVAGCGETGAAGTGDDSQDSDPGIATLSERAGIDWILAAEEMPGLEQRLVGQGADAAVIIRAVDSEPSDRAAIYLHAWLPTPPHLRADQIRRFTDLGYQVIYPVYQDQDTDPDRVRDHALAGIEAALADLDPDPTSLIVIGETTGGVLAFEYAALAASLDLLPPRFVIAVHPGRETGADADAVDLSAIPPSTQLFVGTSANSRVPGGSSVARDLLRAASRVPAHNRTLFSAIPDPGLGTGDAIAASYREIENAAHRWLRVRLDREPGS